MHSASVRRAILKIISALFVLPDGPYSEVYYVDLWSLERDARKYRGPYPVVAHPPCERWGRYWAGGPSCKTRKKLGDDDGCFESALDSVRKWTGVLEHPEASHAFKKFGLPIPSWNGGWTEPDEYGGRSACVSQGKYGHPARKMTWLYAVGVSFPELDWGPAKNKIRLDLGFHSAEERKRLKPLKKGVRRLTPRECQETPEDFRDLLLGIAQTSTLRAGGAAPFRKGAFRAFLDRILDKFPSRGSRG